MFSDPSINITATHLEIKHVEINLITKLWDYGSMRKVWQVARAMENRRLLHYYHSQNNCIRKKCWLFQNYATICISVAQNILTIRSMTSYLDAKAVTMAWSKNNWTAIKPTSVKCLFLNIYSCRKRKWAFWINLCTDVFFIYTAYQTCLQWEFFYHKPSMYLSMHFLNSYPGQGEGELTRSHPGDLSWILL